jgi:glycosyltransferase involved in cell wall biosynthesis
VIGTGVIDARLPAEGFDFRGADRWHVLVLYGGVPAARVDLPSPGAVRGDALVEAALVRRADAEYARLELIERLRRRLGVEPAAPEPPRVSLVVCTHRRSRYLADLIESVGRLDPQPFEAIVVDNDPGEEDCREAVEAAGLRYVREDRRGLDNGRNAGIRAARGVVVAFTDDDCVLSPGWLRPLARAFAQEAVTAATGPAFPYLLDTPARVRMEHQASLARGLQRVTFDWQTISPLHAAAMGVGANMAIRRERLLELGEEPFPPELDAGTETESGGDSYLLGRLLAAGDRVVYDPEMFVFHQHRADGPALRKAVRGYGIGLSAALTKLVVEQRELTAPRAWAWLPKQYLKTQRRRAVGRADAVETRISWDYLRGGFLGCGRWRAALRTQAAARLGGRPGSVELPSVGDEEDAIAEPAGSPAAPAAGLSLSVIVPTFRREAALRRCLGALARQDVPAASFEVIVVDDDPDAVEPAPDTDHPFALRHIRNGGAGAAAARNRGAAVAAAPLVLFLDDDVVADPWLLRRHLAWHRDREEPAVLVGPYRPRPSRRNLAAISARLWWQDLFGLLGEARAMTFVGALTANVSLPRTLFDEVGGFSERYSRQRREDWEWGLRVRRAGIPIAFEPAASARHEFTLGTAQRLRDARREGVGDTLLVADFPEALPSLPLSSLRMPAPREPLRWLRLHLWDCAPLRRATIALLDLLEAGHFREAWGWVFRHAQSAAYAQGAREGGWRRGSEGRVAAPPPLEIELASAEPVAPPAVAAQLVRVTLDGTTVAEVFPREGIWTPALAEQIVDAIEPEAVMRAAVLDGAPEPPVPGGRQAEVEVVFGPASPAADLLHRAELEAGGALVRVAEGEVGEHWQAVVAAVRAGERPLVALPLPGVAPRGPWLADALAAFDGERVGLVFGGSLGEGGHPRPLYLHDRESADASLVLAGAGPAYLILRRELAVELAPAGDLLEPVVTALAAALDVGWAIGHREARGLGDPAHGPRELARAFGRVEARRQGRGVGARRPLTALASATARGILTVGWLAFKRRGRLSRRERELSLGTALGAVAELRASAACRAGLRPRGRSSSAAGAGGISPPSR